MNDCGWMFCQDLRLLFTSGIEASPASGCYRIAKDSRNISDPEIPNITIVRRDFYEKPDAVGSFPVNYAVGSV